MFTLNPQKTIVVVALSLLAFFLINWQTVINPNSGDSEKAGGTVDSTLDGTSGSMSDSKLELYTLKLERSLSDSERAELARKVDWMRQLDGVFMMVRTGAETANKLKELPYIREINTYQPEEKMTGELQSSFGKDAGGQNIKQNAKQLDLTLTLVKAEDKSYVVKLVQELDGVILDGANTQDNYLRVRLPVTNIKKISTSPWVLYVEEYHRPEFLNDRARDITGAGPLAIPNFFTPGGLTGKNVIVGLADSGLDTGKLGTLHPDLRNDKGKRPRVLVINSLAGVDPPADNIGHGTHMAGTIVGSGAASAGKYAGIAPDASLYFQGIVDANDNIIPPHDLSRLFMPAYEAGARIHVNGWGRKNNQYASAASQIDDFVRQHPDFIPIFGAGNFGPGDGTLTSEANSKNALVVGASRSPRPVFDNDTGNTQQVADFSSSGPTGDGRIKPELLAPGTSIISTCSSLVESNLPGREEYTRLQGTSMAAAVTGGSAALLAEYFQHYTDLDKPSAALLKAVLINGARPLDGNVRQAGFGLLDMAGTVLALQQKLFELEDNRKGIAEGDIETREFKVKSSETPFKVTLAWTDPPATPGAKKALVNNLDLVVISPDGKKHLGNDSSGRGVPDSKNNVEQVVINNPVPGNYKIEVHGTSVNTKASSVLNMVKQDFALVYGQPPLQSVVVKDENDKLELTSGKTIDKPGNLKTSLNGKIVPGDPLPGSDIYLAGPSNTPEAALAVGRSWQASGIKALFSAAGTMMVRINRDYREGGYYIDEHPKNTVKLNGIKLPSGVGIPPGASIEASINPTTQKLWQVLASSHEVEGVVKSLDWDNQELELLNNKEKFNVASELAVTFNDKIAGGDPESVPFGAPVPGDKENIMPGMPVRLILGQDGTVYHMEAERQVVVGDIASVDVKGGRFSLTSGDEYQVLPGIKLLRDDKAASFSALQPGDLVMGIIIPGSNKVLALSVYSTCVYGRVYFAGQNTLYITDNHLVNRQYRFNQDTRVYRWGLVSDTSLLAPGQWVRLIINPNTGNLLRVDIAETGFQGREVVKSYNQKDSLLSTESGHNYVITSKTSITKNGYPVQAVDLLPGEEVDLVSLRGQNNNFQALVSAEAHSSPEAGDLNLFVESTIPFENFYIIKGKTPASKLLAWYADGRSEPVKLTNGEFYYPVYYPNGGVVQLVAVDAKTGAVTGVRVKLPDHRGKVFNDIAGHWAEVEILSLVSRGMLAGYGDNSFRPEQPITRVEFTAMLTRLLGGQNNSMPQLGYKDTGDIPEWAKTSVRLANGRGLITGYEDNTFRPRALLTRAEATVMFVRLAQALNVELDAKNPSPNYRDAGGIPGWARTSVDTAGQAGLLGGRAGHKFEPQANITRAETAAVLNRLLNQVSKQLQQ
ncbi:S8 family serine peptidase [Desulfallas sp. Bu1-1]|uniref:S8 family serine peptidase n=1 Tax=Desulfallas sp. Bu1-1 TaxID=2787620 RepID=UPI00189EE519|nr:S8 family serine peptidase [Desulfallas sp. Bu1-1]MBF7081561.1 S8 family serine peptidase [Desulfallas sp. Bu1-1]